MQVVGGPTQILIWGSELLKVLPDKLRGTWSFGLKGGPKILGGVGAMNPNDAMCLSTYFYVDSTILSILQT